LFEFILLFPGLFIPEPEDARVMNSLYCRH